MSTAEIRGDREVIRLLRDLRGRVRDMTPVWDEVGDYVSGQMRDQFASEGAALLGRPWKPLSPPYLAWKIARGFDPRRLRKTGAMRESFVSRPMAIEETRRHIARFGSDDPKAAFHQRGTSRMPARPIMVVGPEFAADVNRILSRFLLAELRR